MNKIIELVINLEEFEFEDLGATIISLVDHPAIEVNWLAFAKEQFVEKIPGESQEAYLDRCIPQLISEGMDQDQAIAVCYNEFKGELPEEFHEHVLKVAMDDNVGEVYNPDDVIYLDMSTNQFAELGDYPKLIDGVNILKGLNPKTPVEVRYRYAGPSAQRSTCRTLKALNKLYKYEEILAMAPFGMPHKVGGVGQYFPELVWEYKMGVNCRHYWEQVIAVNIDGKKTLFSTGPANGDAGRSNNRNWKSPAGSVPENARFAWVFNSEEKQIVTGPAMIPNQLILRKDEMGNPFHVYFSRETIEQIARKFLADNNTHNTDINHDNNVVNENTLLESWIVEDPEKDKAAALGFDVPKGTWMVSYKINNKETWSKIKSGQLNGYSIEGAFIEKLQNG